MRLTITIAILLSIVQLYSQSPIEDAIDRLFEHYDDQSPGVTVLITKSDSILYKKDFGQANLEYGIPISSNTIFNATSLSKQFVAFGIYLLEKEERLSFDDEVQDFLPQFPHYSNPITIRHLLSHTSGIRDQWGLLSLAGYKLEDHISNEVILDLIVRQQELNFEPGTQFEYCHSNYTLLAQVIEAISGMSLNEYLKESIFGPLNMDDTFFLDSSVRVIEGRAYSYERIDGSYSKVNLNCQNYGPTNLMTTAKDLSKWVSGLSNYELASPELIRAFDSVSRLNDGTEVVAVNLGEDSILSCQGQFYRAYKGFHFLSHGGSLGGFRSFLGRFPDEGISIILLGNDNTLNTYSTALNIADILFELNDDGLEEEQVDRDVPEEQEENVPATPSQYVGNYFNEELGTYIQVALVNDQLQVSVGRNREHNLKYIDTDQFEVSLLSKATLEFLRNETDDINGIKVSTTGVRAMIFGKSNKN